MGERTWDVNIYIEQSVKGLKRQNGIYGYVVETKTVKGDTASKEVFEEEYDITAHEMELIAILNALQTLNKKCIVTIHSPHGFFKNAYVNHWIDNWKKNNWVTAHKQPVANRETWKALDTELSKHSIIVADCKSHSFQEWMNKEITKKARGLINENNRAL